VSEKNIDTAVLQLPEGMREDFKKAFIATDELDANYDGDPAKYMAEILGRFLNCKNAESNARSALYNIKEISDNFDDVDEEKASQDEPEEIVS
jgi:hypothetical protein